ncbi:MAG: MarR family transcriptional regulator [Burkholderiales bacterium]|nr:MarR family transcriptional regulator [Burkholderiales bacterium]
MTKCASTEAEAQTPPVTLMAPQRLSDMLDYRLYLVYRDCGYITERLLRTEFGINRRRWRILATVFELEGATLSEIAEGAEMDRAQASRSVGMMVREGFLKRMAKPGNARYAKVVFTAAARELYEAILARYREANVSLLASLSAEEVGQLDVLLGKLRARVAELQAVQPAD